MKARVRSPHQMSVSNPSLSANPIKSITYLGDFQAFRGIFQGALRRDRQAQGASNCAEHCSRWPIEAAGRLCAGKLACPGRVPRPRKGRSREDPPTPRSSDRARPRNRGRLFGRLAPSERRCIVPASPNETLRPGDFSASVRLANARALQGTAGSNGAM